MQFVGMRQQNVLNYNIQTMKYISNQTGCFSDPSKNNKNIIVTLIVFLLFTTSQCQDLSVQLAPGQSTNINAVADYIFLMFPLPYAVPSGATLGVTFPSEYSATTLHSMKPYTSYSPSNGDFCWPFGACSISISLSGNTFFFNGLFPNAYDGSGSFFTQLTVFNIKNADSLTVGTFSVTIFKGSTIYYPPSGGATVNPPSFTASTMSYSTSLQTSSIWATSTLTLTLTPNTVIDTLILNLPSIWANQTVISSAFFGSPLCSSDTNPTMTCSILGSQLTATNLQYYTASQPIRMTIHSMYNPSSVVGVGSIAVTGQRSNIAMATATVTLPSSSFTHDIPRKITSSVAYQSNTLLDITITMLLSHVSMSSDVVRVTLPTDFAMSTSSSDYSITGSNTATTPSISFNTGNNTFSFLPFSIDLITRPSLTIVIRNVNRPRQAKTTGTVSINTYRAGSYLMDSATCCSFQLAKRLTLKSTTPQLSSYSKSITPVTYTFNLTTVSVNLVTSDALVIEWPPAFSSQIASVNNASVCTGVTLSVAVNPSNIRTPTCSVSLNKITLTNFLISNSATTQTFIVSVSGRTNPSATPVSGFNLATVSANKYIIQQIKNLTIILTANTFSSFTIAANSSNTNSPYTLYTFGIGNSAPLSNGYTIRIDFPADYTFIDYAVMVCTVGGSTMPCGRLNSTYESSTNSVIISVNASVTTVGNVTVSGVTNPKVQGNTAAFAVSVIDAGGNTVEASISSVVFPVTGTGPFTVFSASVYNLSSTSNTRQTMLQTLNTPSTSLFVDLVTPFRTQSSPSSLILTIKTSAIFTYYANSTCSSSQFTGSCVYSTDGSSNVLVTFSSITFTNANTNYLKVKLSNVAISYTATLTVGAIFSIGGKPSLSTSTPTHIGQLYSQAVSNYTVTPSSYLLGATSTSVTLSIGFSALTLANVNSIDVFIPQQFGASARIVSVPVASFTGNALTISSLTNPVTLTYTPFTFIAYDSNSYPIAFSSPSNSTKTYSFALNCSLPCRTCSSTNTSACLSCYSSLWLPTLLSNATATCNTGCQKGQYLSGTTCFPCNTSCLTCVMYGSGRTNGNKDVCLSCASGRYLFNSTCYATCPGGYYASSNTCATCLSVCLTCSAASTCLTCLSSLSLLAGKCLSSCPSKYIAVTNSSLNSNCLSCPTNCLVCSNTVTCTTCEAGFYLSGTACVSACTSPLLPNYINKCVSCACLTCSSYSFNCTSCGPGLALYLNQCLSTCPSGYYPLSRVCLACIANCDACTSATYCTICRLPYVLSIANTTHSSCLTVCPTNTIATIHPSNFSYLCSACTSNCLTCQIDTSYCLTCSPPFMLSNHSCVLTCPAGQFGYNNSCVYCYPECHSCDPAAPTTCFVCSGGYYFSNNSCLTACPSGSYANISTLKCTLCSALCLTCVNSTNCTSCVSNYFLHLNYCYNNCTSIDPNYYSHNGLCLFCQPMCATCYSTSPYHCVSCSDPSYYHNPTTLACTSACLHPYYANSTLCVPCQLPCLTCDTVFNSCLTCSNSLLAHKGACVSSCPDGYSNQNGKCQPCSTYCMLCSTSRCLVCQPFAYLYNSVCVLDCSVTNLPITINNYCTSCAEVPYCQDCLSSVGVGFNCFICVYPYVVFNGDCLNQCPENYAPDANNYCQQTAAYAQAQNALYEENKPKLPPFAFFVAGLILAFIGFLISTKSYKYTYHCGYLMAIAAVIDLACILYGLSSVAFLYRGDYSHQHAQLPLLVLAAAFGLKQVLSLAFLIGVIGCYYLQDIRYRQWKELHPKTFKIAVILTVIFGPRMHKLFYSKFMAKSILCYRILSVQKFYRQDVVNWLLIAADLTDIAAFVLVAYNIFIAYAVLYIMPFQVIAVKCLVWVLFLFDLKKPDRGFFLGDQEQAEKEIKAEEEEAKKKQRQYEIQGLAKLIKCQSAGQLHYDKMYQHLFWDDYRSVFDPKDYEDVPKVPKKKIAKYIQRGRFRKGKKISIEQKLRRFAESIKPAPAVDPDPGFMNKWLYWKPPKNLRAKPKEKPKQTEQSMLNLLRDKEILYSNQLREVEIEDLEMDSHVQRDSHYRRKKRDPLIFEMDEETIGHQTFYEPTSIEYLQDENRYEDLLNRNYAKKKHLPDSHYPNPYDEHQLRILHHQPQKKRPQRMRINDSRVRRG